ncbi:hypothetical protein GCM10009069_28910 [Algimonas arctica]|uniref:Tetratricopeptide repeat protein n=2 Tax=Algimonas arctica TaxID=1479486 RepID=A0A8J3G3K4_9PROT|nr:hypothetical protein GCM10009069_28910 [Algimonas arctica]
MLGASGPVFAQGSEIGTEIRESGRITFQDIYDNPDDADLNLAYAKQQAESGDLIDAASTLERLLIQDGNWDSARLFYAVVLYNLDDRKAADREFTLLETRDLTAEQLDTVGNYRQAIQDDADSAGGYKRTVMYTRVLFTSRYDDNAGAVVADTVIGNRGRGDESFGLTLQTGIQHELKALPDVKIFASGTFQNRRHEDFSEADYDVYGVSLGVRGIKDKHSWSLSGNVRSIDINSRNFVDQLEGSASYGLQASQKLRLRAFGRYADQSYKNTETNLSASDRSGHFIDTGAGLDFKFSEKLSATAEAAYQTVSAKVDKFNYEGPRLTVRSRYNVNTTVYLDASGTYRKLDYDLADGETVAREDKFLRLRGALGVNPAMLLAPRYADGLLGKVTVEIAGHHSERLTNSGPDFENTGGEIRLILDF